MTEQHDNIALIDRLARRAAPLRIAGLMLLVLFVVPTLALLGWQWKRQAELNAMAASLARRPANAATMQLRNVLAGATSVRIYTGVEETLAPGGGALEGAIMTLRQELKGDAASRLLSSVHVAPWFDPTGPDGLVPAGLFHSTSLEFHRGTQRVGCLRLGFGDSRVRLYSGAAGYIGDAPLEKESWRYMAALMPDKFRTL